MSLDTLQTINFAGKDGFQWFFAKVVPQEYWKGTADALNLDGKQSHRAKIRICGYDTFEESELLMKIVVGLNFYYLLLAEMVQVDLEKLYPVLVEKLFWDFLLMALMVKCQ